MTHDNKKGLIPRSSSEVAGDGRRKSPVIKRMTRDVLTRAEVHGVDQSRFRIGDYEFREPDYRQVLQWAEVGNLAPERVVEHLSKSTYILG